MFGVKFNAALPADCNVKVILANVLTELYSLCGQRAAIDRVRISVKANGKIDW